jgi:hypothetical protein
MMGFLNDDPTILLAGPFAFALMAMVILGCRPVFPGRWKGFLRGAVFRKLRLTVFWETRRGEYNLWCLGTDDGGRHGVLMVKVAGDTGVDSLVMCRTEADRAALAQKLRSTIHWTDLISALNRLRQDQWNLPGSHQFHEQASRLVIRR